MKLLLFLQVLWIGIIYVDCKGQYVEPLNMGLQMAIPYDIANVFNRPIAGFITTFLSCCLVCILFFGVITSPFGYMFGIPSRKYVLGNIAGASGRSFDSMDNSTLDDSILYKIAQFDFPTLASSLLHHEEQDECNLRLLCYAHSALKYAPPKVLRFYQLFSRRLINANEDMRGAIKNGLVGLETCDEIYSCPFDAFKLMMRTFSKVLPSWWGKRAERGRCSPWTLAK